MLRSVDDNLKSFSLLLFVDINDCLPNRCKNGGNCTDQVNNYVCTCDIGYAGRNCGISKFLPYCFVFTLFQSSYLSSSCFVLLLTFLLRLAFFTDIDDCADTPCKNYGTCNDLINGYNCSCTPGYTGQNCTQGKMLNR